MCRCTYTHTHYLETKCSEITVNRNIWSLTDTILLSDKKSFDLRFSSNLTIQRFTSETIKSVEVEKCQQLLWGYWHSFCPVACLRQWLLQSWTILRVSFVWKTPRNWFCSEKTYNESNLAPSIIAEVLKKFICTKMNWEICHGRRLSVIWSWLSCHSVTITYGF